MNLLYLLCLVLAVVFIIRMLLRARPGIDLTVAQAAVKSGAALLVDVREPSEWSTGVARFAALLPLSDLRGPQKQWRAFLEKHSGQKLLFYCRSGTRSGLAAVQLRAEGFDAFTAGSLHNWARAGWPICTPKDLR